MQIEVRGDKVVIDGYVNAVGRDSRPIRCQTGDFVEQVEPGVFGKALKRAKNIKLLLNHRTDRELGSTADGNLTLTEDSIGLRAHAEIGDEEVIRKARNHQLSGWSFGMYVNESEMEQRSNAIPRRKLKDIDMFEVSVIDTTMLPCYAGTSVECRAEGENAALLETRAYDDAVEVTEKLPENYFDDAERQLAQLRAESDWLDAENRLGELRYNPYHDPTNGRFTTSSGGGGGYLFVGKGEKGKGQYVYDRDIDGEYEEWKNHRGTKQDTHFSISPKLKADIRDGFIDAVNQVQERFGRKVNIKNVDIVKTGDTKYEQGAFDPLTKTIKLVNSSISSYEKKADKFFSNGWWASKDKYGTFYHEIGHSIWEDLSSNTKSKINDIYRRTSHLAYTNWMNAGGSHSGKSQVDFFSKSLSKYGATNVKEFFGESFSQIMSGRMRPVSREVNLILMQDYALQNNEGQLRAESDWLDAEKRLEELRYNPYHDPTNGRFTTSSGAGGGYLFVGKGEKGKGQYVIDSKEFKPKIKSYQQKAMDRMNEILSKDKTISKMPEYTILDSGNIEFKYEKTEIFTKEKGGKMPDPSNADTVERISEVTGTILVDEKGNRKIFGKRHNTISEKVIKKGKRTSVKNTKGSNKNSSDVSVFVINEGTPSQFFGIKTADGDVLPAPNNWKTEKGALRWAEKNGYAVSRAFDDNDIDYAEEQLAQLRAESAWLDAEKRATELRAGRNGHG